MGNSASKAAAKVKPTPAAMTMPSARPLPKGGVGQSAAIRSDGQDPTFMQNIHNLGVVNVPRSPTMFRSDNRMLDILQQRKKIDEDAADSPTPNRLSSQALSDLLDDRKSAKTREELDAFAREYRMDPEVLEQLGRKINSVSIKTIKSTKKDGEDTQIARWVEPIAAQAQIEAR